MRQVTNILPPIAALKNQLAFTVQLSVLCYTSSGPCLGGNSRSLHLIRSSDQQGSNLLKVEFIKVGSLWTII